MHCQVLTSLVSIVQLIDSNIIGYRYNHLDIIMMIGLIVVDLFTFGGLILFDVFNKRSLDDLQSLFD